MFTCYRSYVIISEDNEYTMIKKQQNPEFRRG